MKLNKKQKAYIKKNYRNLEIAKIAADLQINQVEVEKYLKKKIPKKKYERNLLERQKRLLTDRYKFQSFGDFLRDNNVFILVLIGLVFSVYLSGINNGFVSDDIGAIVKNENIGKFSAIFRSIFGSLQSFIHFLTFRLFELNPAPFRLTNILLHTGSTVLVFSILSALYKKSVGFFAAALFAVHPLLTESITWISGMPYVMYGFLFLLSFYFYLLADKNKKYYYFSLTSFFLACITSEKAIPLFLVFVLYEWLFRHNRNFWKITAPFFAISLVLGLMFAGGFGKRISQLEIDTYQENKPGISPLVQIPVAVSQYFALLAWPSKLTIYHTEMSFSGGTYFAMTLLLLATLAALVYSFWKNQEIFFWLSFFFIALSVTLAPLGVAWIVAERYVYLASLGIFVILAFGLDWLREKSKAWGENFEKIFYILAAIIVLSLSVRTIVRNGDWKNEDTLWIATARVSPSGQQIHNNLGDVYGRQGNHEKAIEEFKKAIEINPNYADAYHNLANTYQQIGQIDLAIKNYEKSAQINPAIWQTHQNLAIIYLEMGEKEKALQLIKKALEIAPDNESLAETEKIIQEAK